MKSHHLLVVALIIALLGFVVEYTPLSQESRTTLTSTFYEKDVPYEVVSTFVSSSSLTRFRDVVDDASDDSDGIYDISEVIFEKSDEMLITYVKLSHGRFEDGASFSIFIDPKGDEYADYAITLLGDSRCYLVDYVHSEKPAITLDLEYRIDSENDQTWIAWTPFTKIGTQEFYIWVSAYKQTNNQWNTLDSVPDYSERKITFSLEYVETQVTAKETIRRTSTHTVSSGVISTYTVRTTLPEGNFLAFVLFTIAGVSALILLAKSLVSKVHPSVQ